MPHTGPIRTQLPSHRGQPARLIHLTGQRGEARFTQDADVTILVATDAAGEGLNLQRAHLMVNYDLPWNPNRIEQRFGRIHRIGQTNTCRLWNLVADGTREGMVFERLLTKLEERRRALGGKVFDVLGEAFSDRSLRQLLIDAIRSEDPVLQRRRMEAVIDGLETTAPRHAGEHNAPQHLKEVQERVQRRVERTLDAVESRLEEEIRYWGAEALRLKDKELAGQSGARLNSALAGRRAAEAEERLQRRRAELTLQRKLSVRQPRVVGGALVAPAGLMAKLAGTEVPDYAHETVRTEKLAATSTTRSPAASPSRAPPSTTAARLGTPTGTSRQPQDEFTACCKLACVRTDRGFVSRAFASETRGSAPAG